MTPPQRPPKVFGIGLSGTGSHSLVAALKTLGYRAKHYPKRLEQFDEYDALADIPVSARFELLDQVYPGSRFVLTTRELEGWLANRRKKRPDSRPRDLWVLEARHRVYGRIGTDYDEGALRRAFADYHARVREHFAERPGDLLTLDIVAGEGWERLCPFLGVTAPEQPFPRVSSHVRPRRTLLGRLARGRGRGDAGPQAPEQ